MAQISSPHIWYPDGYPGPLYNLREVVSWTPLSTDATRVLVQFTGGIPPVEFDTAAFEAAKQASIDAE